MRHFARFTPTIYWTTRARAADPDAPQILKGSSQQLTALLVPCISAWDVDCPRDVILREFTVSLARRHAPTHSRMRNSSG